jgi:hypothetical protein
VNYFGFYNRRVIKISRTERIQSHVKDTAESIRPLENADKKTKKKQKKKQKKKTFHVLVMPHPLRRKKVHK